MALNVGEFLIFDSSALIDYCRADKAILKLVSLHLAPILIPLPILQEVRQLTVNELPDLGFKIHDPSLQELIEAGNSKRPLSLPDMTCFILARDRSLPCVTNDKKLRSLCEANDIKVFWGLEPLLWLVTKAALTKQMALTIAKTIQENNPRFLTEKVLQTFSTKLRQI